MQKLRFIDTIETIQDSLSIIQCINPDDMDKTTSLLVDMLQKHISLLIEQLEVEYNDSIGLINEYIYDNSCLSATELYNLLLMNQCIQK